MYPVKKSGSLRVITPSIFVRDKIVEKGITTLKRNLIVYSLLQYVRTFPAIDVHIVHELYWVHGYHVEAYLFVYHRDLILKHLLSI